ncbi:WD repeat protein, putative [Trichomonas vaginalis G3]|uniref:WD repeat protein, putative n=1 Tax=Trichomonas vaginalis (strain ATCC PRA-98 / G3) TaxID=412133 RepID=A2DXH0_TRIV3|nr:smooth muscle cell migration [Trichomonas vaginalis G3]EAY14922.1 WD repeat protein, putative [Trichomonas vaginalis G3]KAI5485412.1 smooth muscle cell migration [Trichomonas vaginalis G3]|eukprot:XP_001327145.1 WD repeat protein [Trichomonas vaginalis G3]
MTDKQQEQAPINPEEEENFEAEEENGPEIVIQQGEDGEEEDMFGEEEDINVEDQSVKSYFEHKDPVYCTAFAQKKLSNGCIAFASGGGDDTAVLYHIKVTPEGIQDAAKFVLKGHVDSVSCLSFSADGSILATADVSGLVKTWDTLTGKLLADCIGPTKEIRWLNFHPSLPACLAGDEDGMAWFWNAKTGKCAKVYVGHSDVNSCGSFRADGSEIWTASYDGSLRVWSPRTGQTTAKLEGIQFHQDQITTGQSSPTGILVATGDASGVVYVSRFDDVKILGKIDTGANEILGIRFSPDCAWIAIASFGGNLIICDSNEFKIRHVLEHPDCVICLRWHPTKPYVITGCGDGSVRVWDIRNASLIREFTGNKRDVHALDVHLVDPAKSDLLILTSSEDKSVRLFSFVE